MDLGSAYKLAGDETSGAGQFIFSTWARAQARKQVGGWARRAQASPRFVSVYGTIKSDAGRLVFLVDKLENLNSMGYYEN